MKFRFTLTHRGSETEPIAIPPLEQWSTQTGTDHEWSEGPIPSVTLPGAFPTVEDSEYFYVDYGFEDGVDYSVTITYTVVYNPGLSIAKTATLDILDNSFAVQFSQIASYPGSPGGQASITLAFTANSTSTKIGFKASAWSDVTFVVDEISGTGIDPGDTTESLEINEPDGWKQAVMKLARDKEFYSLVEFFDGSFIFYGDNGVVNGGLHFIEFYEISRGLDANIEILIEIAPDDETYETCFEGQLDLSLAERLPKNKYRVPIIRDNFWAKFNSRLKTPVDLQAFSDLDADAVTPVDPVEITLTDQLVTYFSDYNWLHTMTYPDESADPAKTYMILAFDEQIRGDIPLFALQRARTDTDGAKIFGLFEAPWNGEYRVQIRVVYAEYDNPSFPGEWSSPSTDRIRIRKTNENSFEVYQFNGSIIDGVDNASIIDVDETYTLARGEQLSIMLHSSSSAAKVTVFGRQELTWLEVDLATTTTNNLTGEDTIDGVLTSTSRVLVKNQGNPQENGIYVTAAGAWSRATDMDSADEFNDVAVYVSGGTDQTDTAWRQTETVNTVDVDAVRFVFTEPSDEWQKPFPEIYDTDNYTLDVGPEPAPTDEVFTDRTTPGSFIKITATTVYPESQAFGFLIHDGAAGVINSLGLGGGFYSELLGSQYTNARQYEQDGCGWRYAILRGLQIRGYTLSDKPFSMSFEQWWKGIDPILCLGLEYDFIEGSTLTPISSIIEDLFNWDDAGGTFPGGWNYAVFGLPFTSVNGDGGVEGYTCGAWATTAGITYALTTVMEVFETGSNPTDITFIWAILDASFNEIVTQEFTYSEDGFHDEVFNMTPTSDGTYFAVRVINNTVSDTKSLVVALAIGEETTQLLTNVGFDSAGDWTNEGAGTAWSIASSEASVTLVTGSSTAFTQEFSNDKVGRYYWLGEFTPTGIGGGESLGLTCNFYDAGDNLITSETTPLTDDSTDPWAFDFTSVVPITKVEIVAEVTAGSDISIVVRYAALYVVTTPEPIITIDEQVIRVEKREFFYQQEMSVLISNISIDDISRKYDTEKIYNKIDIGYSQWQSEDISGIDDPQTKHTYSDRLQKVGQEITVHSDFIGASLAIETTRRQTIEKSTDYKFDNNTFIIAINTDDVSPDAYRPELAENFSSVLNLLNYETRYNLRISVARNFLRWRKWFNGCLQSYLSSFFRFVSGEGNFDMVTTMTDVSPDCLEEDNEGQSLSEKQNIEVTDTIIHTPFYYEMDVPMEWETYKTIRENRRNAIGISLTDFGHVPLFIDQLDYTVMEGKAKITGWTKEYFALDVVEGGAAQQDCQTIPPVLFCENAITDEFGNYLTDENGLCITEEPPVDGEGIFDFTFDDTFE
jgi:hypothetical protein